ncbi:MAG: hypothetical protein WBG92_11610, partial [Thiohalocapsa sp.]
MSALFEVTTTQRGPAKTDWLLSALRRYRSQQGCWASMSRHIKQWLGAYSLSPAVALLSEPDDGARAEKIEQRQALLDKRLQELAADERAFLNERMTRSDDVDSGELCRSAFHLLVGMPIEPFAEPLVAWSYAQALNGNYRAAHDEFRFLIYFNTIDWQSTRNKLMAVSDFLQKDGVSTTGRWAMVGILRATATDSDAHRETILLDELTRDRSEFKDWSLIQSYCNTDPCDPEAAEPTNLAPTVEKFQQLDVNDLSRSRGMTAADHFFSDALPAMARFAPTPALLTMRTFLDAVLARNGEDSRLGLFSIEAHAAALKEDQASKLKTRAIDLAARVPAEAPACHDLWVTSQIALLVAMPFLGGNQQLAALMALRPSNSVFLRLADTFKPADRTTVEQSIETVCGMDEPIRQTTVLFFVLASNSKISDRARKAIGTLIESEHTLVRACALAIIAAVADKALLQRIARSDWRADRLDEKGDRVEIWHG